MHYLTELAGKLVTAYQEQEEVSRSVASRRNPFQQQALIEALRTVLEREVADHSLHYSQLHRSEPPPADPAKDNIFAGWS